MNCRGTWNVLKGEMSLVGPRPHSPTMKTGDVQSSRLVAEYAHRHRMKPGMTGWAAIQGSRGPVNTPVQVHRRVALDIEYIERQSFWLDLYIMIADPALPDRRPANGALSLMFWRGVMGYLPVNVVQGVVGLLTIVVLTRILSPADYGVYALAFSAMSLVYTSLFVWLEAAMARFYAPEAQAGRLAGHFATVYRTFAVLAVGFPLVAGAILWLVPMPAPLKFAVGAGLGSIVFRSLLKLAQERRRAAGDVKGAALIDIVQTIGGFVIGAGLAACGWGGGSPLIGMGAAAAVCLIWALPSELRRGPGTARSSPPVSECTRPTACRWPCR